MVKYAQISATSEEKGIGTTLTVVVPELGLSDDIKRKNIRFTEIRLDDGRHISVAQRKKAYATIKDICDYTGYMPEEQKEWMKYLQIMNTGCDYFSLSDCSMDTARVYINTIMDYCLDNGIPLNEPGIMRTDDIMHYLWKCMETRKCAVCGRDGEIHHWDAIGMGNNRQTVDDSKHRKICLCRTHHTIAHQRGNRSFEEMYHVYGITYQEEKEDEQSNSDGPRNSGPEDHIQPGTGTDGYCPLHSGY